MNKSYRLHKDPDLTLKELAKAHEKNAGYPHSLIVGYADSSGSLNLLEVYKDQIGPVSERLVPYRFAPSGELPCPVVVIPCTWNELKAAARSRDPLLTRFLKQGKVYLAHPNTAKRTWETLKGSTKIA